MWEKGVHLIDTEGHGAEEGQRYLGESPVLSWREGPRWALYPSPPSCQNGKFMEFSLAQVNKLLLPLLAPPAPARSLPLTVEILSSSAREWGRGGGVYTAKLKEPLLLEREGHAGGMKKKEWLSSTFAGCRMWRPWSRTFFKGCQRERDEFGCCCPPLPLLPRFHGDEGGTGCTSL